MKIKLFIDFYPTKILLFYLLKGIIGGTNLNLKPSFINQFCKGLERAAVNSSKLNDIFLGDENEKDK